MSQIDIRALRELATPKITQADLARLLGKDQATISRWEQDPDAVPTGDMLVILGALGVDDVGRHLVTGPSDASGIDPGDPLADLWTRLSLLRDYSRFAPLEADDLPEGGLKATALRDLVDLCQLKPRVAFHGRFDAGKTTVINYLLGERALPTAYQPATRVVTYVRSIDDRPDWISESVWMLRRGFKPERWKDEVHCTKHRIVAGGLETLRDFGTHSGTDQSAEFALVFLDAPILKACDVIDLPGTENDSLDTKRAGSKLVEFDAAVYLDPFIGFLGQVSLVRLGEVIRRLPAYKSTEQPLSNLLIVATHAHPGVTDDDIRGILDGASGRLWRQLGDTVLARRADDLGQPINGDDLRDRFTSFYRETPLRCDQLRAEVTQLLGRTLPSVWEKIIDERMTKFRDQSSAEMRDAIAGYREMMRDREQSRRSYEALVKKEPERYERMKKTRSRLERNIAEASTSGLKKWSETYTTTVHVDTLEQLIKHVFPNKKDAQENAGAYLIERLQNQAEIIIEADSKDWKDELEGFLNDYRRASLTMHSGGIRVEIPFNAEGLFAGGLVGLAGVGALAFWASTLGNLGAYIIAAKGVGVLASMGLATGGTAVWMSAIAAVGGPITFAVGIVAMVAILGWALFGPSWERRLAKKLVTEFDKRHVRQTFLTGIEAFWSDTATAFSKGADAVESSWQAHLRELADLTSETSFGDLSRRLQACEVAKAFFECMPWPHPNFSPEEPTMSVDDVDRAAAIGSSPILPASSSHDGVADPR